MFTLMEIMNMQDDRTHPSAESVFADPVGYLASLGIAAVLVAEIDERFPEAA